MMPQMGKSVLDLFRLDGKVAYVTGGGQGLGEAMSVALARAGASVAVVDINPVTAKNVADKICSAGGRSIALTVDVTKSGEVEAMVRAVADAFGKLDIAVNNAGVGGKGPIETLSEEDWKRVMDVNVNGVFRCAREAGRQMIRQGSGGVIINIASMSGTIINRHKAMPARTPTLYCTTKAAVKHLTKALAVEWAGYGIRVNSISPGYMRTPLITHMLENPARLAEMIDATPMGRIGEPWELAGAVVYLASDASSFVTGHDLVIDGGHTVW